MDTYKVEDGDLTKYTICTLPGGASGAGEWCREYCMFYGTGRCHYDKDTGRMLIRDLRKLRILLESRRGETAL